jgi:hypothetical protein
MNFIEIFLFILAGQYVHVLVKIIGAFKKYGADFKFGTFFLANRLTLLLNGSIILIGSIILTRVGFGEAVSSAMITLSPMKIFNIPVPANIWLGLSAYIGFLFAGYFAQSIFYWLMKGGLKKTNMEVTVDEKDGTDGATP